MDDTLNRIREAEELLGSDPAKALELARTAAREARAPGDARTGALAERLCGHANKALDRHAEALDHYAAARRAFLRAGDAVEAARTLIGRIDALMYLDRVDAARRVGRQALREFDRLGDCVRAGRVLMNLGNLEHRLDRPARAIALYGRARDSLASGAPDLDLAFVDFNLGNILAQVGRHAEAEAKFRWARGVAESAGHRMLLLFCDFGMAELDAARARFPAALRRLEECQRGLREIGHDRGWCNCLLDRAEIYHNLSLFPESLHAAEQAEEGFRRLGLSMEATRALFFRGLAAIGSGDAAAGRRLLRRAAREFTKLGNSAQAAIVDLRRVQSGGDAATLESAKREFRRQGLSQQWAEAQVELARIAFERKEWRSVARRLASAAREVDAVERPEMAARVAGLEARLHERRGRGDDAVRAARACLGHLETLRERLGPGEPGEAHLARARGMYQHLFRIFRTFLPDGPEALFDLLVRVEEAGASRRPTAAGTRAGEEIEEIRDRLTALTARQRRELPLPGAAPDPRSRIRDVRKLERELLERTRRRRLAARGSSAGSSAGPAASVAALQARLRNGDVWIHFVDQGESIGALAVTAGSVRVLPTFVSPAEVRAGLERLRYHAEMVRADAQAGGRRRAALTRSADAALAGLGETCLGPVASAVEGAARVFIRPAAGLEAVPWGALPAGDAPLWEHATVCLVAGAAPFAEADPAPRARRIHARTQLWAAGGDDLPGVREEVERVREVLGGGKILKGEKATRARFLRHAADASLLHFAGHGSFRRDNPLFSSLRFTDGDLYFLDLEPLALAVELVVLSACRTGEAQPELGLGTGLARGFLQAGARALMSSLWRIGDAETRDFMQEFYGDLRACGTPDEALRRTALRLRAHGRHAADWAGFQLVRRTV